MMSALTRTTRKRALSLAKDAGATSQGTAAGATRGVSSRTQTQKPSSPPAPSSKKTHKLLAPAQSFRWIREHRELPSGELSPPTWSCVLDHRLWCLREADNGFQFRTFRPSTTAAISPDAPDDGTIAQQQEKERMEEEEQDREFLRDYLQLDVPLTDLYAKWSNDDANFKAKAPFFPGVRILRQDPAIKLCQEYGPPITIPPEDADDSPRTFYGFPVMEELAQDGVEETLRRLGFGYRAKYIAKTAKMIQEMDHGEEWLRGLRNLPYEEAHSALLTLQGVGPKVADCICLMSLDKQDAIPVDTHVWQIAVRDYKFRHEGKVPKTITSTIYKAVGKHFVDLFGEYSGWASSVLFAADLRTIEGRVKIEDPDGMTYAVKAELKEEATLLLSSVKVEEQDLVKLEVADIEVSREEDQESSVVSQSLKNIKLEVDPLLSATIPPLPTGRRQSKRRKGA
ncbi:8-oxoguanine glycosylase ogg1 [Mortierella alpina]|nr:8-oxoguanine glycosylase ogg1 [Mortierella alpina]